MKEFFFVALIFGFFSSSAFAARSNAPMSLGFELGVGSGTAKIKNPDGGEANYEELSFRGRLNLPLWANQSFGMYLVPGYRFSSFDNAANNSTSSSQVETAKMKGFGAGLHFKLYKFYLGYELYSMNSEHQLGGVTSSLIEYEMMVSNLVAGLQIPLNSAALLFEYNQSTGDIPASATGLGQSSQFSDSQYWINLRYNTSFEMGGLFDFLFE